jgi:hypothetical protein
VHTGECKPSADTVRAARAACGADTRLPREEMEHLGTLVKDGASTQVIKYVDLCMFLQALTLFKIHTLM